MPTHTLKGDFLFFESMADRLLKYICCHYGHHIKIFSIKSVFALSKLTALQHRNLDYLLSLFWIESEVTFALITELYEDLHKKRFH